MTDVAQKFDGGKIRPELLPFPSLESVSAVFAYGANKYADHNYRKGMAWSRLLGAALRHLFRWACGEDIDAESGHPHLAHAGCCVLMLLDAQAQGLGVDDRWRRPPSTS
jgi:hypothetical protein